MNTVDDKINVKDVKTIKQNLSSTIAQNFQSSSIADEAAWKKENIEEQNTLAISRITRWPLPPNQ